MHFCICICILCIFTQVPGVCFDHHYSTAVLEVRYKMLARLITLSVSHCVKDNEILKALHLSSNCFYKKFTILRPLKAKVGYGLSTSKLPNSDSSSSGFLSSICLFSLMVLLNRPFFHLSMADNVIAFRCSSIIYPRPMLPPSHFRNSLSTFSIERVNLMPLWDFCASDFQRVLKIIIIAELFIVMTISPG